MILAPSPYDLKLSGRKAEMYEDFLADWEAEEAEPAADHQETQADRVRRLAAEMGENLRGALDNRRAYEKLWEAGRVTYNPAVVANFDHLLTKWLAAVTRLTTLIDGIKGRGVNVDAPDVFVLAARDLKEEIEDAAERKMRRADAAATARKFTAEEPW